MGQAAGKGDAYTIHDYFDVCYNLPESEIIRPGATALVADCRAAGRKVGVLTNDLQAFHGPEWAKRLVFFQSMDSLTDASLTGILKPDPRAYAQALSELGVAADDVVFVDDQPRKAEGARQAGITTVAFDVANPTVGWAEARRLLGLG